MKFTEKDVKFLENFTQILGEEGILFETGKTQKVMTAAKTVIASAEFDMDFPYSFAMMDLKQFTSVLSNMSEPEIEFEEDKLVLSDNQNGAKFEYYHSALDLVRRVPGIREVEKTYELELSKDVLTKAIKMARIIGANYLQIYAEDGGLYFGTTPTPNKTNLKFRLGDSPDNFVFCLELEKFMLIGDSYDVEIWQYPNHILGMFKAKNTPINYIIAANAENTRL